MSAHKPSLGYISIWSDTPEHYLLALLGDTSPTPRRGSQAYGGWSSVKRARRRSIMEWAGVDGLSIEVPVMIDSFATSASVEAQITQLERMAGRTRPGTPDHEPPLVYFNSAGVVPHDAHREPSLEWVIEDLEFGDADRNANGDRTRQHVTVVFAEYVEDDDLAGLTPAQRRKLARAKRSHKRGKGSKKASKPRYVVKNGDTLESIAAHQLGRSSRWHELKSLNPKIRDPKKPIPAGTILTMP